MAASRRLIPKVIGSVIALGALLSSAVAKAPGALAARGDRLDRDTSALVDAVRASLTAQGQWPPANGSVQMNLCQALEVFSRTVKESPDLSRSSNFSGNSEVYMAAQRLQAAAAAVDPLIGLASSGNVGGLWLQIKNEISAQNSFAAAASGMGGGSMFMPGAYYPNQAFAPSINGFPVGGTFPGAINTNSTYSPYASQFGNGYYGGVNPASLQDAANRYNGELNSFINEAQKNLGRGGFQTADPGLIMNMSTALSFLQQTSRSVTRALSNNGNFAARQAYIGQILSASDRFESAFKAASPSIPLQMRFATVKQQLTVLVQLSH